MVAKIWNYRFWIKIIEPQALYDSCSNALEQAGFTVLNYMEYKFKPQGFSALFLLAESHLAIHTFPEKKKTYIELSSCNEKMYKKFKEVFTI